MKFSMCCKECLTSVKQGGWFLTSYYNISGFFCADCYDKISHDSYGSPNRPKDYMLMLLKHGAGR